MQPWNTTSTVGDITLDLTTTHGLSALGHGHDPDVLIAATKGYLGARGLSRLDAHNLLHLPNTIQEAWWDGIQFVGAEHPNATAVTVINLPPGVVALVAGLEG